MGEEGTAQGDGLPSAEGGKMPMPRGSEELTSSRKEEIIDACAALYEAVGFQDVTIRAIGERTSFTRTSIYNYFQTKEEIFLALLQREHEAWIADLEELLRTHEALSAEAFAGELGRTLARRECMLRLESMNLYDIEGRSRLENLVAFKRVYGRAVSTVGGCLERFFPDMTAEDVQGFLYAFFPFLLGAYPYAVPTEKQRRAMELAGVARPPYSLEGLVRSLVIRLLAPFSGKAPATPGADAAGTV